MPFYHTLGTIPRKRHIAFRKPDGGLYAEQLVGHEGFTGTSALLYHVHPPTTVKSVKRLTEMKLEADDDQTLRHRHFRTSQVKTRRQPDARPHSAAVQPGRRDALRRAGQGRTSTSTATRRRTRSCTSRRGRATSRRSTATSRSAKATISSSTAASCIAIASTRRGEQPKLLIMEGRGHIASAQALSQRVRPAHRGRAVFGARHPRAARAEDVRRDGRLPHHREAVRRDQRDHPRPPSARRRRLGPVGRVVGLPARVCPRPWGRNTTSPVARGTGSASGSMSQHGPCRITWKPAAPGTGCELLRPRRVPRHPRGAWLTGSHQGDHVAEHVHAAIVSRPRRSGMNGGS